MQDNKSYLYKGIRTDTAQNTEIDLYSSINSYSIDDIVTILSPTGETNFILGQYYNA